jgi:hypothetical protein
MQELAMTTINHVRVTSIDGARLTCHVDHVYATHWKTILVSSRTLALFFLRESLTPYNWRRVPALESGEITQEQAAEFARSAPLQLELGERDITDESWNRANVGRFISCAGMVDHQHCDEMWADVFDERWDDDPTLWDTKPRPQATFLITVTDPRWLVHLTPGMEWASTAYDQDDKIAFDPAWRTSDVLALSRGIEQDLAFDRMPILADALQDAGCDCDDLLNHLRDTNATHVRGCWALDLVLGKS